MHKSTGKVHLRTGQEGPEGEKLYAFKLGSRCRWVVNVTPRSLYSQERPGIYCIGG